MASYLNNGRRHSDGRGATEELVPLKGGDVLEDIPRRRGSRERCVSIVSLSASAVALGLCIWALVSSSFWRAKGIDGNVRSEQPPSSTSNSGSSQLFDELGRFIVEDYDAQPPFSDFLPALAGYYGKPLYGFYVNRGQGIASFGIKSKEFPIMEFYSANHAYQNAPFLGFRTFLQGSRQAKQFLVEPFSPLRTRHEGLADGPKRYMYVGSNEMQIQEIDSVNEIETNVTYFILPEEDFGAFVKRTTVTNLGRGSLKLSMVDGLAKMEPAGGKLYKLLKGMGRTLEGWMGVYQPYSDTIQMPYYRLSTEPTDNAAVIVQTAGHWCLSAWERSWDPVLLPIIYDGSKIFGQDTTLLTPVELHTKSVSDIIKGRQYGAAKTASAFSALDRVYLSPGESLTVSTFFGKAEDIMDVPVYARRLTQPGFVEYKEKRSREIIQQITAGVSTETSRPLLDGHVQQMFLDNSLRGGIPSILGEVDDDAKMKSYDEDERVKVYHLFSRIHGDLERDYNDFLIEPTFFSQGPGNFRDVAQNRRNDVIFNPRIGSFNLKTFLSFIQADGYNPMTVEATIFTIKDIEICSDIAARAVGEADGHRAQREALTGILNSGPFRPGQLFSLMEEQHIELMMSKQEFIDMVSSVAEASPMAVYDKGFWADHFCYYMDLIESFLSIYPDWEERIMFDQKLPYFFSPAYVKPRSEKYVLSLSFDGRGHHVRQLDATIDEESDKILYLKPYISNSTGRYKYSANWQHDASRRAFKSSPIEKLFLLATVKFATRDAYGMGIEYEGGRPGWNDANNGLVGMVGSGLPETFELAIILRYILSALTRHCRTLAVPAELGELLNSILRALDVLAESERRINRKGVLSPSVPSSFFQYWDTVATAREEYRSKTKIQFTGETVMLRCEEVMTIIDRWLTEIDLGIERAIQFGTRGKDDPGTTGIVPTYFSFNVTRWKKTGEVNKDGHPLVMAKELMVNIFPLFLEGPTRMMKTVDSSHALDIYQRVRGSPLRDEELNMYTLSSSLRGQSIDIGREMAFAPGWLENQSVWLHMSYKFYLELIRHGLFEPFFDEMLGGGMLPFMDPKVYGRSLMECSSFIASSAFEDPSVRGRGFLARLSGSTAEFLSMWALMMIGPKPFFLDEATGELRMQLVPALPRWLFDDSSSSIPTISFKLFSSIDVTYYHFRGNEDLFGVPPSRYVIVLRDGSTYTVTGPIIPMDLADKIRRVVFVASIDAIFE